MPRQACERTSSSGIVEEIWVLMVHCEAAPMRTNDEQLDISTGRRFLSDSLVLRRRLKGLKSDSS